MEYLFNVVPKIIFEVSIPEGSLHQKSFNLILRDSTISSGANDPSAIKFQSALEPSRYRAVYQSEY